MKNVSAHASKKGEKGKPKSIHFSKVSNGLKSQIMNEPQEDSPFGGEVPGEEAIHSSMGHAVKHLKNTFQDHMAAATGSGGGATQPTPGPGPMAGDEEEDA